MTAEILKEIPHQKLLKAVVRIAKPFVHSFVSFPHEQADQWRYVLRFDPNGIQDTVGFVPGHVDHSYETLVRILGVYLELSEAQVLERLLQAAKDIKPAQDWERL